jgi:CelD/BcsL family acetyltransferase involved in cellulose biosynthesis
VLVEELLGTLARGEAEVVHLPHVRADGPLYLAATRRPPYLRRQHAASKKPHWRLLLPGSEEEFLRSRSPRTREGVRRQARRLAREYGETLTIELFRDRDQLDRLFADAEQVTAKTYQWQLGVAFRDTPLQRSLTELAMDRGWFRAYVLYLEGRPVAFWHGLGYAGIFRTGVPAYDPSLANLNLGTYLLMRLIADLCADESIGELDYGFGDAEYKRRFGDERWDEDDVLIFAPSVRAVWINLVRTSLLGVNDLARRILGRRNLAGRLKRAWRRRLAAEGQAS